MTLDAKEAHLLTIIRDLESVAVAFSAGVDSTCLLAACASVLGAEHVLAVIACSPGLPAQELCEAQLLAHSIGVPLQVVETNELENPAYTRNDRHRCFYCKETLFTTIAPIAHTHHLMHIVYGATADDLEDYRPGMLAAQQHGVRAPLLEAGLSKAEIRALSQRYGLPTHNKPATPCLASRIPYGKPITIEMLGQVARAEVFLKRSIGLRQVRVRHHGHVARLEVDLGDMPRLIEPGIREVVVERLRCIGFTHIALDLAGFRSGSMNETLHVTRQPGPDLQHHEP